jgi:glycosyltransferase involved in cell wall biosynthesis
MSIDTGKKTIAYVFVSYDVAHSGVLSKIFDQVAFWKRSGYLVKFFVITGPENVSFWKDVDESTILLLDTNIVSRMLNRIRIVAIAINSRPNLVYVRESFPIRIPNSSTPIFIEVQSLVGQELKFRSRIKYLFFNWFKRFLYAQVHAAIYVSNELREKNEFKLRSDVPTITISNGIDLSRIKPLPPRRARRKALFFIGSANQPWQGIAELLEFAKEHEEIDIHIVGDNSNATLPNVFFYGRLGSQEYRQIASKCIAGVATLNLQVKQMTEASPLKVREYLALGLPVILRYRDTDLPAGYPFVLQLPADGRPLASFGSEIEAFMGVWSSKRVARSELSTLDVGRKEIRRLDFFEEVYKGFHGNPHQKGKDEFLG